MKNWLRFLLAFFVLCAEAPPADDPPGDEPPADEPPADEPPADEPQDAPPAEPSSAELRARAERAERERDDAQRRADDERRRNQPVARTDEERLFQAEDERLRDPKLTPNEKWQIESNRVLRRTEQRAARAEVAAFDTTDRTSFQLACQQNKRFAAVSAEVENEVAKARERGQYPKREDVAYYILGRKVATAKAPAQQQQREPNQNRGQPAGVRSNVQARGQLTDRQKRAAKLENVQI